MITINYKDNLPNEQQSTISEIKELVKPIVVLEAASTYYKLKLVKTIAVKSAVVAAKTAKTVGKSVVFVSNQIGKLLTKSKTKETEKNNI